LIINFGNIYIKKKKINLINDLKYKLKRTKKKYYLYIKYYEKVFYVKNGQSFNKLKNLRKDLFFKEFPNYKDKNEKIKIKEYSPRINTKNENPVVTQEKEKERALHRTVVTSLISKFSINNYYRLNLLLKDLTMNQLFYQPFIDKKGMQKQLIEEKRNFVLTNIKDRVNIKDEMHVFKSIINDIKKNIKFLNSIKKNNNININKSNDDEFFLKKLFNYLILEKKIKNISKNIFKVLNIKDLKLNKKKDKLDVTKFFKNVRDDIKIKEKINKLSYFYVSKNKILNEDKLEVMKRNSFCSFSKYINREELEKMDNKLLYNTVKKYNEENTKAG
jgi:hypothetical protein